MRPYFNYLIEQFPNINAVSVFGAPANTAIVQGGGALQGCWLGQELGSYLFRYQGGKWPHMIQIGACWALEEAVTRVIHGLGNIAAMFAGVPYTPIEDVSRYLVPARGRSTTHTRRGVADDLASNSFLSRITGLVATLNGDVTDIETARFLQAEENEDIHPLHNAAATARDVTRSQAISSMNSIRSAEGHNGGALVRNWECDRCGSTTGVGCDYNAEHKSCRGHYCLLNRFDPQVRGYCSHCNTSGKYGVEHYCSGATNDSGRARYRLVTPRTDFEYDGNRGSREILLVRGFDMINNIYSYSMAGSPLELARRIMSQAEDIFQRHATRIAIEGIDYAIRVGLKRWWFARVCGRNQLVTPLVLVSTDTISRLIKKNFLGRLQDGSFSFNNWRYEGVPIIEEITVEDS